MPTSRIGRLNMYLSGTENADDAFRGSQEYFSAASKVLPRGYNSGGRFRENEVVFSQAKGAHLVDVDGNVFIDCVLGLGPVLVGHGEEYLRDAIRLQAGKAIILGAETPQTLDVARRMHDWIPCADYVFFPNTGSEAVQTALRIARATTGRRKILKFEGHFHGWMDPVHVSTVGAPPSTANGNDLPHIPAMPGQIETEDMVIVTRWNDIDAFRDIVSRYKSELAAVIMEPIPFNFGTYFAEPGYLEEVRKICTDEGILLIFDEVVSGFRMGKGGAQSLLGITPDLATFAKAFGGGFPVAMVAGTSEAMRSVLDEELKLYGTYNANPLAIAAVDATTRLIESLPDLYEELDRKGQTLAAELKRVAHELRVPLSINQIGSVLQLFWSLEGDARSYASCQTSDKETLGMILDSMLLDRVHIHPRGIVLLSYRHSDEDIESIVEAFERAIRRHFDL